MKNLKAFWDSFTTNQNLIILAAITALHLVGALIETCEPNEGGWYVMYFASALIVLDVVMVLTGLNKRR